MYFFIDWQTTLECVLIALAFACCLSLACFKPLGILQSFSYANKKLLAWAGRKSNLTQSRFTLLFMTTALSSAVFSLCFNFLGRWAGVVGLSGYLIFFVVYFVADISSRVRCEARLTPRFKRLYVTLFITFAVISYLFAALMNFLSYIVDKDLFTYLRYVPLSLLPLCALLIVCLANLITKIWEAPINAHYVKTAKKSLKDSGAMVIGITGSYGKTGTKNILYAMLTKKYRVLITPYSYNTPQGVAKTINAAGLGDIDIFVAEMGARQKGDIAKLCSMCPPTYSMITGICPQHLQSFKTVENIIAAKGEIISATERKCFIAESCFEDFNGVDGNKIKCDCVSGVVSDCTGTSFTLTLGGKTYPVKTKLLGAHSAYNIGLCAALSYELGISAEDIVSAAESLPYVEHRLQLITSGGVNIIDDGYNSNVVGAKAAVEVLKSFGGDKIVVTPGLVELGVLEEKENAALGAQLVGLDYVILVGETQVQAVFKGYIAAGGDMEKVICVSNLLAAQEKLKGIIKKGDTVLFLNDLPAQYL